MANNGKVWFNLFGVKLEWNNLSRGVAVGLIMTLMFAIVPTMLYVGFLVAQWAIFTLFAYTINGWQYIAALVLLSMVSSHFKRDK